jgi:hypothetical protein
VSYPQKRNAYENLNRLICSGVGDYDIPELAPVRVDAMPAFIGFNYAKSCKEPETHGIHFFLDDYQFARLWNRPDDYLELLGRFQCVTTPDFSTYTDFPKAIQIYNHYRKHWLGAYWQTYGMTVIPTISWSDKESFAWCFDGEPVGGVVAVSSVGTQQNADARELFTAGYLEMMNRLQPETVLFYGNVPDGLPGNIVNVKSFQERLRKYNKTREKKVIPLSFEVSGIFIPLHRE